MTARMTAAFERIILHLAKAELANAATLNPILSRADVLSKAKALRFELTPSLIDLYSQCANGMTGPWALAQLMPPYRLLALDEAIELRRFWDELNAPGFDFRPLQLFPILQFDADSYSVWCGSDDQRGVVFISHKETTPVPIADSLDSLLEVAAECWESSIYATDDEELDFGEERERRIRAVHRKHDRGRTEALLASLNAGVFDWLSEGLTERLFALADARAVPALIRELWRRSDQKSLILHALAEIASPETYDTLLQALKSREPSVQIAAAKGLGRIGDRDAVPALIELFGRMPQADPHAVRVYAAAALARLRDPSAVEPMIVCLQSADFTLRQTAAKLLGQLGDPRAIAPLVRMLVDRDERAAAAAAEALGSLGSFDESAVPHLLGALERGSQLPAYDRFAKLSSGIHATLGASAARALAKIASPRAAGALAIALDDLRADVEREARDDRRFAAAYLSSEIASALSASGYEPATIEAADFWLALIDRVESSSPAHLHWATTHARQKHLELLARCSLPEARTRFESKLAASAGYERATIVELLGRSRASWAVELLARALTDPGAEVRAAAVEGLGARKVEALRPDLELALDDENALVRWQSARALERIASRSSIPRLTAGLEDASAAVAAQCARALAAINRAAGLGG